jgi:glycosyltransferase involved in cell wall biosynthesis
VKTGILESRGGTVAFMDADGSTPVSELVRSMRPIQEGRADIVIGSRRAKGASIRVRQPLSRRLLGRAFGLCNRLFLGLPFLDTQCGFKVFRGDCGRELFREIATSGFAFDLEVLLAARAKGLRILEIGVAWNDTPGSTVSPVTDGLSMLRTAWQLRTRARHRGHGAPVSARPPLAPLSGSPAAPVRREGVTNHA